MKNVQLNELYKCLDAERLLKTKLVTLARPHHSPLLSLREGEQSKSRQMASREAAEAEEAALSTAECCYNLANTARPERILLLCSALLCLDFA